MSKEEKQDSSMIEESIAESLPHGSRENLELARRQASATVDSIQEEDHLIKSATPSQSNREDEISEDSYLKDEFDKPSDVKTKPVYQAARPVVQTFSKKIDRIRDNIEDDYDNDGFESYHGSLQADKLRAMQTKEKEKKHMDYRMSKQVIQDFEENKGIEETKHKQLLEDLRTELDRYEQAVGGSIFLEQF